MKKKVLKKTLQDNTIDQIPDQVTTNTEVTKKSNRHILYFKFVTIFLSLISSLYLSELFLSWYFILPEPIANYYAFTPAKSGVSIDVDQYEYKIGYKFNSQGFRDREIPFNKGVNEKRILFLGDSTTEGFGIDEDKRFSNLLLSDLGKDYVGINVGQLATNPDTYFDNLITFGVGLKPDVVIMGISISNDFMGGRSYKLPSQYTVIQNIDPKFKRKRSATKQFLTLSYTRELLKQLISKDRRLIKRHLAGNYWDLYFNEKITKKFYTTTTKTDNAKFDEITKPFNQNLLPYFYDGKIIPTLLLESVREKLPESETTEKYYTDEDYKNTFWFLKESNRLLKKNNIRFIVVLIPDVNQVNQQEFQRVLKEDFNFKNPPPRLAQLEEFRKRLDVDLNNNSIEFLDVTDKLKESKELTYYLYDQHTNPLGHKIIEKELAKLFKN